MDSAASQGAPMDVAGMAADPGQGTVTDDPGAQTTEDPSLDTGGG
jgi:hypothetical protein